MIPEIVELPNEEMSNDQVLAIIDEKRLSQQESFVLNALK